MRRTEVAVVLVIVLMLGGLAVIGIQRMRGAAARTQCTNNLKLVALGLHNYASTYDGKLPAGTVWCEGLAWDKRLSWYVEAIPFVDQFFLSFDRKLPWDADPNLAPTFLASGDGQPARYERAVELSPRFFHCPAGPEPRMPGKPGVTHYVGIAGVGSDAAERYAGCLGNGVFGYDRVIRLKDITDGTANTLAVAETTLDNGPWTAGGRPTVRALDPLADGPYVGPGGQFSAAHTSGRITLSPAGVTNAAMADGAVRSLSQNIDRQVIEALATIAGGEKDDSVGDE